VESALLRRLAQVPDRRARGGLRHPLAVVPVLTACATLVVGGDRVAAIWQWAARSPQDKLARIGARWDPLTGRYLVSIGAATGWTAAAGGPHAQYAAELSRRAKSGD
jgi:hypothetical protein